MSGDHWIRRARTVPEQHRCLTPSEASRGDLWRCGECRRLWRYGDACDVCDRYGRIPHDGMCRVGEMWRAPKIWQRLYAVMVEIGRSEPFS